MTDTAPRFRTIIEASYNYTMIRQQILDQLDKDFTALEKQAKKAEECRDIYHFMITFDFEENFKADKPSIERIKAEFDKYKQWETKMNRSIPSNFPVGLIQLVGRKLRDDL